MRIRTSVRTYHTFENVACENSKKRTANETPKSLKSKYKVLKNWLFCQGKLDPRQIDKLHSKVCKIIVTFFYKLYFNGGQTTKILDDSTSQSLLILDCKLCRGYQLDCCYLLWDLRWASLLLLLTYMHILFSFSCNPRFFYSNVGYT